jgi:hypothetical protein
MKPAGSSQPESNFVKMAVPKPGRDKNRTIRVMGVLVLLVIFAMSRLVVEAASYLMSNQALNSLAAVFPSATPVRTATPFPNPQLHPGETLYQYAFNDLQAWPAGKTDTDWVIVDPYVIQGKYHWDVQAKKGCYYYSAPTTKMTLPKDYYQISFDVRLIDAPKDAAFGLIFDLTKVDDYWEWDTTQEGNVWVVRKIGGDWQGVSFQRSSTFFRKGETNTLTIKISKDTLILYINGQLVGSYTQSTSDTNSFLDGAGTGLSLDLYHAGDNATLEFDNFIVSRPETFAP